MENRDKEMALQTLMINPAGEVWASAGQVLTLLPPPPPHLQPAPHHSAAGWAGASLTRGSPVQPGKDLGGFGLPQQL